MPASETLSSRRFDGIADDFFAGEVLHRTLGPQTGSAICDVACGAGSLALSFADEYPARLVGVDADPSMLESFRKLAAERSVSVETARAATEELPFPDASFDLVVSLFVPHRFQDAARAVGEMARLLRPGGRLAVIGPQSHQDSARRHALAEWVGRLRSTGLRVLAARGGQPESRTGLPVTRWLVIGVKPLGGGAPTCR
ncbi:class I SAM-dependent methyltransferase [Streptomyces sp. NBC_00287]|uniref:class I SAM-dependent methyltransferase n=1 Tax=Streptomyces sp. NBC_00287 TaxID=2975702 RepID=UPI002E285C82|nr:class I SAM-dependent methyltransferase [Streptomyces sp. NBC_00287]